MTKNYFLTIITIFCCTIAFAQNVGINENNPQQTLHLGSQTGTIRVDGLNSSNNGFNGGGVDKTYPLYVNENGDLSLALSTFQNSDGSDAITAFTPFATTTLLMPAASGAPNNGFRSVVILPYTITVNRDAVLEVKYNISFEVLLNATTKLKDLEARNITTFYTLDEPTLTTATPRYGQASKCYFNYNDLAAAPVNASQGLMYNSSTTYIPLTAGTHTLRFYGTISTGTANQQTRVNFAVGNDSVFMRLY